ncbi:protein phosphatase 1 regulatory subunit SDS22 isoform X1 [Rhodamnia argentea]|uniref:Protein phosphatase 1 regulatory subunit SDS22 isoform X1 n=1 Tax=Rhodamnia argentea TaxID=178133 RepID=A0A8B8NJV8_9MYRT|nr:protein phosphatase 1 regulatory subunit SDS22 isoform X1 [Rhodamnia argentea]
MPVGRLSSEQLLKDNNARDADSISSATLNQRALTDVSCLADFKNLQRLDVGFNNLTSLEDLRPCVNLKWLSVVQNKLRSLKGIEGLSKLTVLNAGKNKLRSMDEVRSLMSLRALILNDNEIVAICTLDQLIELNTLVLSRNPIEEIGKSLMKLKSLTKLSLSHCQLQAIDKSLKSCIELKELRLAHNQITALPSELAQNVKLRNLDLGNNLIMSWLHVKVLKSLVNLRNLNLLGNPIAENEKSTNKIRKALPRLQIFNAKPINKNTKIENLDVNVVDEFPPVAGGKEIKEEERSDKKPKHNVTMGIYSQDGEPSTQGQKRKKQKSKYDLPRKEVPVHDNNDAAPEQKERKKTKRTKTSKLDVIDDTEASFMELFQAEEAADNPKGDGERGGIGKDVDGDMLGGLACIPTKKKKPKKRSFDPSQLETSTDEIGMGGLSTWDD